MYYGKMTCFPTSYCGCIAPTLTAPHFSSSSSRAKTCFAIKIISLRNPVIIIKSDSLAGRQARNSFNMTLWNANYMGLIHVYVAYNLYNNAMVFLMWFCIHKIQKFWPTNTITNNHQRLTISPNSNLLIQYSQYGFCVALLVKQLSD